MQLCVLGVIMRGGDGRQHGVMMDHRMGETDDQRLSRYHGKSAPRMKELEDTMGSKVR